MYGCTSELINVMSYKQAMTTVRRDKWENTVKVEQEKMVKYNIFKPINEKNAPENVKLIDFLVWVMKKKPSGVYCAQCALQGFKKLKEKITARVMTNPLQL